MPWSRSVLRGAVVALVVLASLAVWQSATGGERPPATSSGPAKIVSPFPQGIVIVGDSITARYNDDSGDPMQGWWSFVGRHFGARVTTHAQSGSGYLRQGLGCTGNRFIDRPEAYRGTAPSLFIVEGGRNDWASCREGRYVKSTDAQVATAVNRYFDVVQAHLPRSTRIVVLGPPWGPLDPWNGRRVTSIVHASAQRHGLEYVNTTGTLDSPDRVLDGVHPNRAGSRALAARVITALR